MTHSILTIPVRPGDEDDFVAAFMRLDVLGHAARIPAFRGGVLLRPREAGAGFRRPRALGGLGRLPGVARRADPRELNAGDRHHSSRAR